MAELKDVVAYLCCNYPHKEELSKARLTKMVYLADWRSALTRGRQLTSISWVFNHYGPYVEDIISLAREDQDFEVLRQRTQFGDVKEVVSVRRQLPCKSLSNDDIQVLDFVISSTKAKFWDAFIRLVYSTYPIVSQPRYGVLDLVSLAREYREAVEIGRKGEASGA